MRLFREKITRAMTAEASRRVKLKRSAFLKEMRDMTYWAIYDSDTAKAILGQTGDEDNLAFHFGIPMGLESSILENIIQTITNGIYDRFDGWKPSGPTGVHGTFRIYISDQVERDLLELQDGIVTTEKGEDLPWLSWLLTKGDDIIIADYHIQFGVFAASRSGGAIMVPSLEWAVPPEYAGVEGDNWLTRIFYNDTYQRNIATLIKNVLLS